MAAKAIACKNITLDPRTGDEWYKPSHFDIKPSDVTAAGNILVPIEKSEELFISTTIAPPEQRVSLADNSPAKVTNEDPQVAVDNRSVELNGVAHLLDVGTDGPTELAGSAELQDVVSDGAVDQCST